MRSIDLDQYWPMPSPSRLPLRAAAGASIPLELNDEAETAGALAEGFEVLAGESHAAIAEDDAALLAGVDHLAEHDLSAYEMVAGAQDHAGTLEAVEHHDEGSEPAPASGTVAVADSLPPAEDAPQSPPAHNPVPVIEPAAPMPGKSKRRSLGPLLWGGLGFVSGMLAWHVIGFWIFVSDVVLKGGEGNLKAEESLPGLASLSSGKIVVRAPSPAKPVPDSDAARCVELVMNRQSGETRSIPCSASAQTMRDAGFDRHRDRAFLLPRLQDASAWSNTTAVNPEVIEARDLFNPGDVNVNGNDLETGSLQPSDLGIVIQP